jgi:hypothetical protein
MSAVTPMPAVAETGGTRGKIAEAITRFLEAQALLVADQPEPKVGGVGDGGEAFGVATAIGPRSSSAVGGS